MVSSVSVEALDNEYAVPVTADQIEVNSSAIFIIKTSLFQGWLYSNQNHTFCEQNIENYFKVPVMEVFFLFSFTISIQSHKESQK